MTETGAQKRKAEDEVNALGNAELGVAAAPAAKKTKADSDERDALPATTVRAARDGGMSSTTTDLGKASEPAALISDTNTAAAAADTGAAAQTAALPAVPDTGAADTAEPELAAAEAETTVTNTEMADANSDPPQTLGYKTFNSGDDAFQYFHDLMHNLRQNQDLNEVSLSSIPHAIGYIASKLHAFNTC